MTTRIRMHMYSRHTLLASRTCQSTTTTQADNMSTTIRRVSTESQDRY